MWARHSDPSYPNLLFIRADASPKIGTGHIMRCIALAQAWQDEGGQVVFLSHGESELLCERIAAEGFEILPIDHPHPEPSDVRETLKHIESRLSTSACPVAPGSPQGCSTGDSRPRSFWLCLDGYNFTPAYQKAIRDAGIRLLVIDDTNHLPYYHADILLNQNIHAPDLRYQFDSDTTCLLGTRYVLLRREFLKYKDFNRQIPEKGKNILVTMGGADPDNVTLKVVEAIKLIKDPKLDVKIIVGPANSHLKTIQKSLLTAPGRMLCIEKASDMPELMTWADLAISAGGTTCWELAFMGLPNLIIVLADNQLAVAAGLEAHGVAVDLGYSTGRDVEKIRQVLAEFTSSPNRRISMCECGQKLVDGQGSVRVLNWMKRSAISIRRARAEDCRLVWEWANDPVARAMSFSSELIEWERHTEWFNTRISDPDTIFYIATDGMGIPCGQIRFHIVGQEAVLSVSLKPEIRGKGLGSHLIMLASKKCFEEKPIKTIRANVKHNNVASMRAFHKAGFTETGFAPLENQEACSFYLERESN